MSKISDYQLLKDIYSTVDRLETKLDYRMTKLEDRVESSETKIDQLFGKVGIIVTLVTSAVAITVSFISDWVKKTFLG